MFVYVTVYLFKCCVIVIVAKMTENYYSINMCSFLCAFRLGEA